MGLVKITQNPNETALKLAAFQNGGECAVCAYLLQYDLRLLLHVLLLESAQLHLNGSSLLRKVQKGGES